MKAKLIKSMEEEVEVIEIKIFRYEPYHMNLSAKRWNREVAYKIWVSAAKRLDFEHTNFKFYYTFEMHILTKVKCEPDSESVIRDYTRFTQGWSKVYR